MGQILAGLRVNLVHFLKSQIPAPVKRRLRQLVTGGGHPSVPAVKGLGRATDIYVWIADGDIDTIIPLHNFFSTLFPALDTATEASLELFSSDGRPLGSTKVKVPQMGAPAIRVSELIAQFGAKDSTFGSVIWDLKPPPQVKTQLAGRDEPFLLWDRSYIGYVGSEGQVSFVHGIDKARVITEKEASISWPMRAKDSFTAAPEIPLLLAETEWTDVILQNRSGIPRRMTLEVRDTKGDSREWAADLARYGTNRFRLDPTELGDLDLAEPVRLRMSGLPTRYGRAVIFKRFASGAISAMHC